MPDEDIVGVAIEAGVLAELSSNANDRGSEFRSKTDIDVCSNCQNDLKGQYCHVCGQTADTFHRPIWSLFGDIFDGLFGFDGRIWRTLPPLILRPGHVTVQYLSGVRQPFLQPFKLFLAASVLFFLVAELAVRDQAGPIHIGTDGAYFEGGTNTLSEEEKAEALKELQDLQTTLEGELPANVGSVADDYLQAAIDKVEGQETIDPDQTSDADEGNKVTTDTIVCAMREAILPEKLPAACVEELADKTVDEDGDINFESEDGVNISINPDNNNFIANTLDLQSREYLATNLETVIRDPDRYTATLGRWAPRMAFALAPIYGLILALTFFWRRKLFIYDHMIVALHFHSFLFLFIAALIPIGVFIEPAISILLFFGWSHIYLYLLFRRVYGCNWFTASIRTVMMEIIYLIVLLFALLLLMVLGVLFV